jgi:hypothetical protein
VVVVDIEFLRRVQIGDVSVDLNGRSAHGERYRNQDHQDTLTHNLSFVFLSNVFNMEDSTRSSVYLVLIGNGIKFEELFSFQLSTFSQAGDFVAFDTNNDGRTKDTTTSTSCGEGALG